FIPVPVEVAVKHALVQMSPRWRAVICRIVSLHIIAIDQGCMREPINFLSKDGIRERQSHNQNGNNAKQGLDCAKQALRFSHENLLKFWIIRNFAVEWGLRSLQIVRRGRYERTASCHVCAWIGTARIDSGARVES